MISSRDYIKLHEFYKTQMHEEAKRISDSTEARAYLMKHIESGDPWDLLEVAVRCIYDLTGDRTILDKVRKERSK